SRLGLTRHRKGATQREAFEGCAGVGEDDRSLRAVGVGFVFAHESSCLPAYQERAERGVPKGCERDARIGFGNLPAKYLGNSAVDVVHDQGGNPKVSNNILE